MEKIMSKKFYIIIGNYGSGKTEISLNLSIQSARKGDSTTIVDLDIVNPYFRSAFHKELLDKENVNLIASKYTLDASDVPVVTPLVNNAFDVYYDCVIFDVGGDPVGATALGQYYNKFKMIPKDDLNVLFVVNTRRPLTSNVDDIIEMMDKIQYTSRLSITGLINNTNIAEETSIQHIIEGNTILKDVSKKTGIPIAYYGIKRQLINENKSDYANQCLGKPIVIDIYTRLEWMDFKSK
jgi:hypothetical protein